VPGRLARRRRFRGQSEVLLLYPQTGVPLTGRRPGAGTLRPILWACGDWDRCEVASDRDSIVDVVNRYTYALDGRDWPMLEDIFTADAVCRYGDADAPALVGRVAIVAWIRSFLDGCGPSQHLLGNHVVQIDGHEAAAMCKARVHHYGAGERAALVPYECFGVYRDRLRRTLGGWRITERVFEVHLAVGDIAILQPA
jgi:hypothetical protein